MYNAMTHIRLNEWKYNPEQECIGRFYVEVVERLEDTIVNACINAAKEAGINDLYLLDKRFVLDALREKAQRMRPAQGRWVASGYDNSAKHERKCSLCGRFCKHAKRYEYCPHCGAKMDGDVK